MTLAIASSPHGHKHRDTASIMRDVILACLPGIAAQWWFFGWGILFNLSLAVLVCLGSEALVLKLRNRDIGFAIKDNSALVTAVLLGLALPPLAPWWLIVIGAFFAIVFAKQLYGGIGFNPFNPAMAAYVLLLVSFPLAMTSWLPPGYLANATPDLLTSLQLLLGLGSATEVSSFALGVDGVTMATPLDSLKTGLAQGQTLQETLTLPIFGLVGGHGWEVVNLAYLLGGLWLLWRRVISWQIPVAVLTGLFLMSLLGVLIDADRFASPSLHLFSGASMLAAFFIATDPVSASTTPRGRLVFGVLIGALIWLIRSLGGYPDGVAFAVLLANMAVPLIDHYTQPRTYGHRIQE